MSISRQNLSIVIVTIKSENVIHQCLRSIDNNIPIIVIENSKNSKIKKELESKYKNVRCEIINENIGMGSANNYGISLALTDYVFILNPDIILEPNAIEEIILASEKISNFSILAPISNNDKYPNYKLFDGITPYNHVPKEKLIDTNNEPFRVKNVDGFAMLIDKKRLKNISNIVNRNNPDVLNYFDPNFFMYLENNDLCKRVTNNGDKIYIVPQSKINHLAAKSVDQKYSEEIEYSRNWHWIWSRFYYNKKHFGFLTALIKSFPIFFSALIKYCFFLLINNKKKKKIYFNRASGFINALLGKPAWYRPNLDT
tara:strand:- start:1129 stop:2067 length:939 start_codon:yes stop_codon:yes gene_type:complete